MIGREEAAKSKSTQAETADKSGWRSRLLRRW